MEENNKKNNQNSTGCLIFFIIIGVILWLIISNIFSGNRTSSTSSSSSSEKPDDITLMSYAQLELEDNLSNPKYSSWLDDYTFINTGLRYKIEGEVTVNGTKSKFYLIIEFTNETYKEYKPISLQVGNNRIY